MATIEKNSTKIEEAQKKHDNLVKMRQQLSSNFEDPIVFEFTFYILSNQMH